MAKNKGLTHRTPEINEKAERAVIEGLLYDESGNTFYDISAIFGVDNKGDLLNPFTKQDYRDIYNAACEVYQKGEEITFEAIHSQLDSTIKEGRSLLEHMGGAAGLDAHLSPEGWVNLASIPQSAKRVRSSYDQKAGNIFVTELAQALHDANGNIHAVAEEMIKTRGQAFLDFLNSGEDSETSWDKNTLTIDAIMEPLPPRVFLVKGLLPLPSLNIFYGHPGSLKTMVLLDMALCVAAGIPWLGGLPGKVVGAFQTVQAPVVWFDQDSGEDEVRRRIQAISKGLGIVDQPMEFYLNSFPPEAFQADNGSLVDRMVKYIKKRKAKLVVIDCLNSILGEADENSPQMANVMHGLRQIAEKAGAAAVVIHHCPLGEVRLRGHSSINGALDLALSITRESPEAQDIAFKTSKSRKHSVKPFWGFFSYDQAGDDLESARFFGTGKPAPRIENLTRIELAKYHIELLQPYQMKQKDILEALGDTVGRQSILTALAQLEEEGIIIVEKGEGRSKLYTYR